MTTTYDGGLPTGFDVGAKADSAVQAVGSAASEIAYVKGMLDAILGTSGIVSWPASAAPANNVSIAEVLRDVWDVLRNGTGGREPTTNKSVIDCIGVTMAAFDAAAVPGNTVSIAAVLRDLWDAVRNGTGGSEPGTNKSLVDALGFDGVAAVTSSAGMLRTAAGSIFVVKKTLESVAVVQTGVDVTGVSAGGDIEIINVHVQAASTGLATGTNFTLECNNTKGSAVFLSTAISGLGANAHMDLAQASVTKKTVVLESGKKVVAKSTSADCDGAGSVDVYLVCRRLADGASLAAAA